jgi:hypothetical protein
MKFMTIWTFRPENTAKITERFIKTGGAPPEGVDMEARWFDVSGGRGFAISETDDPVALTRWCRSWDDLMAFEVFPIITDEQLGRVLAG